MLYLNPDKKFVLGSSAWNCKVDEGGVNVVRLRKKFTSIVFSTIPTNFWVWSLDFPNFNFKDHPISQGMLLVMKLQSCQFAPPSDCVDCNISMTAVNDRDLLWLCTYHTRREEGCPGFAFEIYNHLRGKAWEVFLVESWRDVSVRMRLR